VPLEKIPEIADLAVPVFVVSHCGKGAVGGSDPSHLLHEAGEKHGRVRNVVSGEDKQIGIQGDDLVDIVPHHVTGHENAGMDVGELGHPQRAAERQGELLEHMVPARIGGTIAGEQERSGGQPAHSGL
jgi:hypothetical protein